VTAKAGKTTSRRKRPAAGTTEPARRGSGGSRVTTANRCEVCGKALRSDNITQRCLDHRPDYHVYPQISVRLEELYPALEQLVISRGWYNSRTRKPDIRRAIREAIREYLERNPPASPSSLRTSHPSRGGNA
jgi:hypothetical protein